MLGCVLMTASRESSKVYEAADGSELPMLVFEPAEGIQPVAGIVMFGGPLNSGSVDGLAPHCRQWASRGIFAVSAGYRLIDQAP
jgi:acetyl esterase